ncbi:MAG: HAD family hydrolase [Anaerolineaceae bacterium]
MFDVIAFDADDTLWHTESLYVSVHEQVAALLAQYCEEDEIEKTLHKYDILNIPYYGYGIKGFILSMIEASIEISDGKITGPEIQQIIEMTRGMLMADVQLLDHTQDVISGLAERHTLMVITKGDLFDQETKLVRSGLKPFFDHVEIISTKTTESYAELFAKYRIPPERFLMVGNSLKSDILPVLELGGKAVYIPYHITWAHEEADPPVEGGNSYFKLDNLGQLPGLLARLDENPDGQRG